MSHPLMPLLLLNPPFKTSWMSFSLFRTFDTPTANTNSGDQPTAFIWISALSTGLRVGARIALLQNSAMRAFGTLRTINSILSC